MEFVEDLHKVNELHDQFAVVEDTSVNIFSVLDLQVFAGREGQGGNAANRGIQFKGRSVECAVQVESGCGQCQFTFAGLLEFAGLFVYQLDLRLYAQRIRRARLDLLFELVEDPFAPIRHIADLRPKLIMQEAVGVALGDIAAGSAAKGIWLLIDDGKLFTAVGALVEDVLKTTDIVVFYVLGVDFFLLPVSIEEQRFIRGSFQFVHGDGSQIFLGKELIDIDIGSAGANAAGPLGHHEIVAVGPGNIDIHIKPLQELIGGCGDWRGKTVFAHEAGRVDDERLTVVNHGFHLLHIFHGGLELLFRYHAHFVQVSLDGERGEKGAADDERHGPGGGANQIDKVESGLVICDYNEGAILVFDLVAKHLIPVYTFRDKPAGSLRDPVMEPSRFVIHNAAPVILKIFIRLVYHTRMGKERARREI